MLYVHAICAGQQLESVTWEMVRSPQAAQVLAGLTKASDLLPSGEAARAWAVQVRSDLSALPPGLSYPVLRRALVAVAAKAWIATSKTAAAPPDACGGSSNESERGDNRGSCGDGCGGDTGGDIPLSWEEEACREVLELLKDVSTGIRF
jgi:hypothetical protein